MGREKEHQETFLARKEKELLQSGTGITITTYFLILIVSFVVLYLLTQFLMDSNFIAFIIACFAVFVPEYILKIRKDQKRRAFDEMYGKVLKRLASSLRSGSTLLQAVDDVIHTPSLPHAIREEMAAVLLDFEFQDTFDQAFFKLYERTGSEDVKSTALSIQISTKYGAKLYEAFEEYAKTIMERKEMEAESRAKLSSVSATISLVSAVPFIFGAIIQVTNPTYFDGIFSFAGGAGKILILGLYLMDVFGYLFLKRKCDIQI